MLSLPQLSETDLKRRSVVSLVVVSMDPGKMLPVGSRRCLLGTGSLD